MSGGKFDYNQYIIDNLAEEIDRIIQNDDKNEWYQFSEETINEFKKGIEALKKAAVYVQRIDWLVSGDDGEESFHKRLKEDLDRL